MKISVIIPTRSRAQYLRSSLASALHAAELADCDVEVVVSDNASDDDTAKVVESFNSGNLRYTRLPKRVSMRQNFESALNFSTGSHIVFIGDDDAVVPHGLKHLKKILRNTDAEIINWRQINLHYFWPSVEKGTLGSLALRPMTLSGRRRLRDPKAVLDSFLLGAFQNYKAGGMIYHGCVSRNLIERAQKENRGPYFWCSSPDVFASMQNLMLTTTEIFYIDAPVTLGGASPRSNGLGGQVYAGTGEIETNSEFAGFISESQDDRFVGSLPASCPSLDLQTLDALMTAKRLSGVKFEINRAAWLRRIGREVSKMPADLREECIFHCRVLLGGDTDLPLSPPASPVVRNQVACVGTSSEQMAVKKKLFKVRCIGGPRMQDSFSAAAFLEDVTGFKDFDPEGETRIAQLARVMSIYRRLFHGVV